MHDIPRVLCSTSRRRNIQNKDHHALFIRDSKCVHVVPYSCEYTYLFMCKVSFSFQCRINFPTRHETQSSIIEETLFLEGHAAAAAAAGTRMSLLWQYTTPLSIVHSKYVLVACELAQHVVAAVV